MKIAAPLCMIGLSAVLITACNQPTGQDTMLVTFKTKAHADITLFGDVAVALLKLMGQSGQVPGALMPEDIPEALEQLEAAVAASPNAPLDPGSNDDDDDDDANHVSLSHRALPVVELLQAAQRDGEFVLWEH